MIANVETMRAIAERHGLMYWEVPEIPPCTHPELMHCFNVPNNAYRYQCTHCGQSLNIYYYADISRTQKEWHTYIAGEIASYFGPEWGRKALLWLMREEKVDYEP